MYIKLFLVNNCGIDTKNKEDISKNE